MQRKIELKDTEKRRTIIKTLKITPASLSQALNFQRNSTTAMTARKMALEAGGILLVEYKVN